tara:strand:+ start:35072 stop:35209 length:138 start_codon:yes stop_codon:yes gene_type:complete
LFGSEADPVGLQAIEAYDGTLDRNNLTKERINCILVFENPDRAVV